MFIDQKYRPDESQGGVYEPKSFYLLPDIFEEKHCGLEQSLVFLHAWVQL